MMGRACYKIKKNLWDVHSTLLGVVEIDFQLFRQKEIYEIASDLRNF